MPVDRNQAIEYAESILPPAEKDFFTKEQMDALGRERERMENSRVFVLNVLDKSENFDELIQKASLEGRIYGPSEMASLNVKFNAIDEGLGDRIDLQETLISKTGQRIIAGGGLQDRLKFYADGYILEDELDDLVQALKAEGIASPEVDKVVNAARKYGAVIIQRGVFKALKSLLQDAAGTTLHLYSPVDTDKAKPTPTPKTFTPTRQFTPPAKPQPKPEPFKSSLPADLGADFVEYLKHNEKNFPALMQSIIADPKFNEFFFNLKKNYSYYKNLPEDSMAEEIIQHPPLWTKLSEGVAVNVNSVVEKNLEAFRKKTQAVAQAAKSDHGTSINELKARLTVAVKAPPKTVEAKPNAFAEELKREVHTPELTPTKPEPELPAPAFAAKPNQEKPQPKPQPPPPPPKMEPKPEPKPPVVEVVQVPEPKPEPARPSGAVMPPVGGEESKQPETKIVIEQETDDLTPGPRRAAPKSASKHAWMVSDKVVAPKHEVQVITHRPPKKLPKVRSRVARYGLNVLDNVKKAEDLGRIEAAHLRQGPLEDQVSLIKSKIVQFAKEKKVLPVRIIPIFEKSPLFQTYLKAGALLIEKNAGMQDKIAMDEVMAELEEMGEDILTQGEFEAVTDLKKDLATLSGI